MSFSRACFFAASLGVFAACGGASFSRGDGDDRGGSSSGGASSGSSSKAGSSPGKGGTGSGGSHSTGGSVSVAGSVSTAGSSSCELVLCAYPLCEDGQEPVTNSGACCPTCPPPLTGCEGVTCEPVMECPAGYEPGSPPGACCAGCLPVSGMVACIEIACPPEDHCPLGYMPGDRLGGCCYDCVPDPSFCNDASDCIVADKPRSCCGCPEALSLRQYQADECWSAPSMPRMIPQKCYPEVICGAVCGACAPTGPVACVEHRCSALPAPIP